MTDHDEIYGPHGAPEGECETGNLTPRDLWRACTAPGDESATRVTLPGGTVVRIGDGTALTRPADDDNPYSNPEENMSSDTARLSAQQAEHDAEMELLRWSYALLGVMSTTDSPLTFAWNVIIASRARITELEAALGKLEGENERMRDVLDHQTQWFATQRAALREGEA